MVKRPQCELHEDQTRLIAESNESVTELGKKVEGIAEDTKYMKKNQDIIGVDLKEVRIDVRGLSDQVNALRLASYGSNGTGGTVGEVNRLKGAFAIVCLLLAGILGFGIYNAKMSYQVSDKLDHISDTLNDHTNLPGHKWMLEQMDKLQKKHEKDMHDK